MARGRCLRRRGRALRGIDARLRSRRPRAHASPVRGRSADRVPAAREAPRPGGLAVGAGASGRRPGPASARVPTPSARREAWYVIEADGGGRDPARGAPVRHAGRRTDGRSRGGGLPDLLERPTRGSRRGLPGACRDPPRRWAGRAHLRDPAALGHHLPLRGLGPPSDGRRPLHTAQSLACVQPTPWTTGVRSLAAGRGGSLTPTTSCSRSSARRSGNPFDETRGRCRCTSSRRSPAPRRCEATTGRRRSSPRDPGRACRRRRLCHRAVRDPGHHRAAGTPAFTPSEAWRPARHDTRHGRMRHAGPASGAP